MKNPHDLNIPMGRINYVIGKSTLSEKEHEKVYDMIAQDYAERHNAPYVHVFENGEFVKTIARKE